MITTTPVGMQAANVLHHPAPSGTACLLLARVERWTAHWQAWATSGRSKPCNCCVALAQAGAISCSIRRAWDPAISMRRHGAQAVVAPMHDTRCGTGAGMGHQLQYEAGLCVWQLTYLPQAKQAMGAAGLIPGLVDTVRTASKEKVGCTPGTGGAASPTPGVWPCAVRKGSIARSRSRNAWPGRSSPCQLSRVCSWQAHCTVLPGCCCCPTACALAMAWPTNMAGSHS